MDFELGTTITFIIIKISYHVNFKDLVIYLRLKDV